MRVRSGVAGRLASRFSSPLGVVLGLAPCWPAIALAQTAMGESGSASRDAMVSGLMYFTLVAVLAVAVAAFAFFLRKRSNREATRRGLDIDSRRD